VIVLLSMLAENEQVRVTHRVLRKRRAKRGLRYSSSRVLQRARMVRAKARSKCIDLGETSRSLQYSPRDKASGRGSRVSDYSVMEKGITHSVAEVVEEVIHDTSPNSVDANDMDCSQSKGTHNVSFR